VSIPLLFLCLRGRRTWFWRSSLSSLGSKLATCPKKWPAGPQKRKKKKENYFFCWNIIKKKCQYCKIICFLFSGTLSHLLWAGAQFCLLCTVVVAAKSPSGASGVKILKKGVVLSVRTYLFFLSINQEKYSFYAKVSKSWKFFICSVGTHFSTICNWS